MSNYLSCITNSVYNYESCAKTHTLLDHPFAILTQVYQEVSDGNKLYPSKVVKDLGVMVLADLSWSTNITLISERARKVTAWVLSAFKTRNKVTMLNLYKSLIRSYLEYCCPLWNVSKSADGQHVEGVIKKGL